MNKFGIMIQSYVYECADQSWVIDLVKSYVWYQKRKKLLISQIFKTITDGQYSRCFLYSISVCTDPGPSPNL